MSIAPEKWDDGIEAFELVTETLDGFLETYGNLDQTYKTSAESILAHRTTAVLARRQVESDRLGVLRNLRKVSNVYDQLFEITTQSFDGYVQTLDVDITTKVSFFNTVNDDDPNWVEHTYSVELDNERELLGTYAGTYASITDAISGGAQAGHYYLNTTSDRYFLIQDISPEDEVQIDRGPVKKFPSQGAIILNTDNIIIMDVSGNEPKLFLQMYSKPATANPDLWVDGEIAIDVNYCNGVIAVALTSAEVDRGGVLLLDIYNDEITRITTSSIIRCKGVVNRHLSSKTRVVGTSPFTDFTEAHVSLSVHPLSKKTSVQSLRKPMVCICAGDQVGVCIEGDVFKMGALSGNYSKYNSAFLKDGTLVVQEEDRLHVFTSGEYFQDDFTSTFVLDLQDLPLGGLGMGEMVAGEDFIAINAIDREYENIHGLAILSHLYSKASTKMRMVSDTFLIPTTPAQYLKSALSSIVSDDLVGREVFSEDWSYASVADANSAYDTNARQIIVTDDFEGVSPLDNYTFLVEDGRVVEVVSDGTSYLRVRNAPVTGQRSGVVRAFTTVVDGLYTIRINSRPDSDDACVIEFMNNGELVQVVVEPGQEGRYQFVADSSVTSIGFNTTGAEPDLEFRLAQIQLESGSPSMIESITNNVVTFQVPFSDDNLYQVTEIDVSQPGYYEIIFDPLTVEPDINLTIYEGTYIDGNRILRIEDIQGGKGYGFVVKEDAIFVSFQLTGLAPLSTRDLGGFKIYRCADAAPTFTGRNTHQGAPRAYGTLTRSPVSSGDNPIMGYRGFSTTNYLKTEHDPLDIGTGEWSITRVIRESEDNEVFMFYGHIDFNDVVVGPYIQMDIKLGEIHGTYNNGVFDHELYSRPPVQADNTNAFWDVVTLQAVDGNNDGIIDTLELYINGFLEGSRINVGPVTQNESARIWTGSKGTAEPDTVWSGEISSVMVDLKRALTREEIVKFHSELQQLHFTRDQPLLENGLIAQLSLDHLNENLTLTYDAEGTHVLDVKTLDPVELLTPTSDSDISAIEHVSSMVNKDGYVIATSNDVVFKRYPTLTRTVLHDPTQRKSIVEPAVFHTNTVNTNVTTLGVIQPKLGESIVVTLSVDVRGKIHSVDHGRFEKTFMVQRTWLGRIKLPGDTSVPAIARSEAGLTVSLVEDTDENIVRIEVMGNNKSLQWTASVSPLPVS